LDYLAFSHIFCSLANAIKRITKVGTLTWHSLIQGLIRRAVGCSLSLDGERQMVPVSGERKTYCRFAIANLIIPSAIDFDLQHFSGSTRVQTTINPSWRLQSVRQQMIRFSALIRWKYQPLGSARSSGNLNTVWDREA